MKNNDKTKKSIALSALAVGTVAIGSLAGAGQAQAADLFSFEYLGSGAELRSELLSANDATNFISNNVMELKCGEGEKAKTTDGKAAEHKCGEGKCGEDKAKKAGKDGKAAEHKCGEGKCGEDKAAGKVEKKVEKKAVEKTDDSDDSDE